MPDVTAEWEVVCASVLRTQAATSPASMRPVAQNANRPRHHRNRVASKAFPHEAGYARFEKSQPSLCRSKAERRLSWVRREFAICAHLACLGQARTVKPRLFSGPLHGLHLPHRSHSRSGTHRSKNRRAGRRRHTFCSRMRSPCRSHTRWYRREDPGF
jgi:hypothetical protein